MGVAMLVAILVTSSGCRDGLAFREDGRLSITEPADRDVVPVPFELAWAARDLPADVRFAVVIDGPPPPAGEHLQWFARHDVRCQRSPACPDDEYLRGLHVHVTAEAALTVTSVPRPRLDGERRLHELTVIAIDREGRRLGETSAAVTVEVSGRRG